MAELRRIEKLSFEEECRLFDLWKTGSAEARRQIIEAHLPLVVRIARNYGRHSIPLADLIQVGVLGLIAAVDAKSYDPRRRRLFKTSYFQVNSAIREAIETSSTIIHVPRRHPHGKWAEQLEPLKARARGQFHSIDDGDLRLKDILSCNGDPAHAAEVLDIGAMLWRLVDGLPAHEAATVRMYYLDDRTFRQIGQSLGVTPQTACKYHGRAVRRLRIMFDNFGAAAGPLFP